MQATADALDAGSLFETHRDRIYRYVLHLVHDRAEAEDLTQETFLRAHRFRDSIRDPGAVRGWLYQIATRVCLDRLRQRKPRISLDHEGSAQHAESIVSVSPSALEAAERKETSQCVQHCLQFLPDHYRAVILMREVYSLTAAEMATLMAVNLTTVKMRLHRARRMLEMVMECGCAVSNDACGLPVCQPKSEVLPHSAKPAERKKKDLSK
jgi:RNA polymerase sigma-70 factor (ECF subfamily)